MYSSIITTTLISLGVVFFFTPYIALMIIEKFTIKSWSAAFVTSLGVAIVVGVGIHYADQPPIGATIAILLVLMFISLVTCVMYADDAGGMKGWRMYRRVYMCLCSGICLIFILLNLYTIIHYLC